MSPTGTSNSASRRSYDRKTWDRLRASELGSAEIVVGRVLPFLVFGAIQMLTLFTAGTLLLDLDLRGQLLPVTSLGAALVVCVVC